MAKDKVNEKLKDVPQEVLDMAQERLNLLCDKYNMSRWKIEAGAADWRGLCYRILGLPEPKDKKKKKGRPEKYSTEKELQIALAVAEHTFLSSKKPLKGRELYETIAKEVGIKPELKTGGNEAGMFTDPAEVVRGIDNRIDKRGIKGLSKKQKK